jgi:sigma-54 dependent transcriptional regulator, acetoin dehydrogenase operon transcriptional activator AcoR
MKQPVHEKETSMLQTLNRATEHRLRNIDRARRAVLHEGAALAEGLSEPWIARSWQRCLATRSNRGV